MAAILAGLKKPLFFPIALSTFVEPMRPEEQVFTMCMYGCLNNSRHDLVNGYCHVPQKKIFKRLRLKALQFKKSVNKELSASRYINCSFALLTYTIQVECINKVTLLT